MHNVAKSLGSKAAILVALAFSALTLCAGQSRPSNDSTADHFTVTGTVINSETKEPLRGALVHLAGFATLSDDRGNFAFHNVPRMRALILAEKPGFFNDTQLPRLSRKLQFVDIVPGLRPVTIELVPEGIVFGQVTSTDGEPLENIPIKLLGSVIQDGRKSWQSQLGAQTDDEGRFRIANVPPGAYYFSAGPSTNVAFTSGPVPSKTAQGYALTYYPSGQDFASASSIVIIPGKHLEVLFSLSRQPLYEITGTLSGLPPGQGVSFQIVGSAGNSYGAFVVNPSTGVFRSQFIPAGSYTIRVSSFGASGNGDLGGPATLSAFAEVNLNSNISDVHLTLMPSKIITFNFVMAPSSQPSIPLAPVIFPVDPAPGAIMNQGVRMVGSPGKQNYFLSDIDPGRYDLEFPLNGGPFYAASARFGNVDLLRDDLVIGPDAPSQYIDVYVRDDGGTIKASVSSTGDISQIAVFAVCEDFPKNIWFTTTGSDGNAFFMGIAPGVYKVFALDNAENLEYRKSGALDDFLSHAAVVTVLPKQRAGVIVEIQHREN